MKRNWSIPRVIRPSKIFTAGEDLAGVLDDLEHTTVVIVFSARAEDGLIIPAIVVGPLSFSVSTGMSLS